MDHQCMENGARNIYSNCNQMRAYGECSPNQSKNYTLSTFPSSIRRNFEDSGIVLVVSLSQFYQSVAVQLCKMVITTVCVQIDSYFCNT